MPVFKKDGVTSYTASATEPASGYDGQLYYNTTEGIAYIYSNSSWNLWQRPDEPLTTYVANYGTPDGGEQSCRFIVDEFGTYVLVGRFAANASASIGGTWSSVRGLDTGTDQTLTTQFSADWGTYTPTEVRIIGATDFSDWVNTRVVDFILGVPTGRQWKYFFSGGASSGMTSGGDNWGNGSRWGFAVNGAKDGKGRWVNSSMNFWRMSDANTTNNVAAYSTPTASAFNWAAAGDAKLGATHTSVSGGQDADYTVGFGYDDTIQFYGDEWPSAGNNGNGGVDYGAAAWILIKV